LHDFNPGDIVFAKMKGYPFWPARIADGKAPKNKIPIFFYGTHTTTSLVPKEIAHYWPNKERYGKSTTRGGFDKAMWEIENDPGIGLRGQKVRFHSMPTEMQKVLLYCSTNRVCIVMI
uniref:PWWP domain-containing protein n=1 Tax=Astyanax mexicanus TaxID=7994 RepID=A0A8B9HKU6_ASTMX